MKSRNQQVDGLRGITVLMIVFYHLICRYSELYLDKSIYFLNQWGKFGVSIFLLISSYYSVSSRGNKYSILKKILRLWPTYFASITLTMVILRFLQLPGRTCGVSDYLLNCLFLNGFIGIPYVDGAHWYITTLISIIIINGFFNAFNISDKEFPYLIWMILAFLMTKIVKCLVIAQVLGGSYVGIACMGASIRNFDKNTKSWKAMLFLALIYSCIMLGIKYVIILIFVTPIIIAAIKEKMEFLESKTLNMIGAISYPLYLIHQNVGMAIEYNMMVTFGKYSLWYVIIAIVLVIALAIVLYTMVEKPSQKILNNCWREIQSG